jgi:hypothetical protein
LRRGNHTIDTRAGLSRRLRGVWSTCYGFAPLIIAMRAILRP